MQGKDWILETRELTREFKGFVAVNNVNLRVRRGSIHALIGPNGAWQDDLLQPAHALPGAHSREHLLQRARDHRLEPRRDPRMGLKKAL